MGFDLTMSWEIWWWGIVPKLLKSQALWLDQSIASVQLSWDQATQPFSLWGQAMLPLPSPCRAVSGQAMPLPPPTTGLVWGLVIHFPTTELGCSQAKFPSPARLDRLSFLSACLDRALLHPLGAGSGSTTGSI